MLQIHPDARTTPVTRAEIARSGEPTGVLARRYGVSTETIRKWRKRGASDCLDRSARPHTLPWKATEEERAIICALRRATNFALDDLTFVVCHFLPHLTRDSIWRILKAEGLNRRPKPVSERPAKGQGAFKDYDLGFTHIDIKHLPKLQTADGERRKRFLYVAIDRRSRSVHLAVKDDETERSAIAFLREAAAAFPFRLTHVLTDNGSCFTPAFARACAELGAQYRHTRARAHRKPMVWWSASTAASAVRCWASPSTRTASSNCSCAASMPPITPVASAYWTARHPIRSWPSASKPSAPWPRANHSDAPVHATSPRHASSHKLPRRSRNQTGTRQTAWRDWCWRPQAPNE